MTTKNLEIPVPERIPADLLLRHSIPAQPWQLATPQPILRVGGMSPYRPTRREFLIGAGSLLVLAPFGCGSDDGAGGETTSAGTRTVRDAFGRNVEVPEKASRVAISSVQNIGDPLIALGVKPHAAPKPDQGLDATYAMPPDGALEEAVPIGEQASLNLEALAAADPDLILVTHFDAEEAGVETFAEVAPTVVVDIANTDIWGQVELIAEAVGVPDRVANVRAEYNEAADRVSAVTDGQSVAFVRPLTDYLLTYHENSSVGKVFADAGLPLAPPPGGLQQDEFGRAEPSLELVPDLDGDILIVYLLEVTEKEFREQYLSTPLWQKNPAVRDGRFYLVSGDEMSVFRTPLAAQLTFDTLYELFA